MSFDLNEWVRSRREREERERPLRVKGYEGKKQWLVIHERYGAAQVFAPEKTSAVWTAAGHWGADPRRAAFHQDVRVQLCRGG